jgi:hypothetical protein
MSDDFEWHESADVVIRHQPAVAMYLNCDDQVVIRQRADYPDDDQFVIIDQASLPRLIAGLQSYLAPVPGQRPSTTRHRSFHEWSPTSRLAVADCSGRPRPLLNASRGRLTLAALAVIASAPRAPVREPIHGCCGIPDHRPEGTGEKLGCNAWQEWATPSGDPQTARPLTVRRRVVPR